MRKKVIPKMLSCLVAIAVLVIILPCIAEASVVEPMEYGWRIYLEDGVDYLSMPVIPDDVTPDAVFGSDVEIFGYEPETGYIMPTVLEEGQGYFVRCLEPKTVDVRGTNVEGITWATVKANLQLGWNLVGIGKTDVTIEDDIEAIGWDAVEDKWITLGKGDTLQRGSAYWIELSLSAPLAAEVSAQQQPPAPPEVKEIVVTSDPTNILADGSSTSNITATVTEWENVASPMGFIIAFEVLSEPGGVSLYPEFDITDVNGNAYSTLTAGLTAGMVVVKAYRGEVYNTTSILLTTLTTPPNITSFAPSSPVNGTVGNWETFTITVNQQVNVSWYLNDSLLFTNGSVTDAKYSLHAEVVGEHNVSAIATNQNGRDMQTWIWYVTTTPPIPTKIPTLMPIGIIALVGLLVLVALSRIKRKT